MLIFCLLLFLFSPQCASRTSANGVANVSVIAQFLQGNISTHVWHLDCVESYAAKHNILLDRRSSSAQMSHIDAILRKPSELVLSLREVPENEWLLFLDWDVCAMQKQWHPNEILARAISLSKTSVPHAPECHIVAQDSAHTVNCGVMFIRNSVTGRYLMRRWLAHVDLHQGRIQEFLKENPSQKFVLGDQRAFTNFLMEQAWRSLHVTRTLPSEDSQVHKWFDQFAASADHCFRIADAHWSNLCFADYLRRRRLAPNRRAVGGVCLTPETFRFNMHDCGQQYQEGDIFYHGHQSL